MRRPSPEWRLQAGEVEAVGSARASRFRVEPVACARWSSTSRARRCARRSCPIPVDPAPGELLAARARLRRLPDRRAHPRRRADDGYAADRPGPPDRRRRRARRRRTTSTRRARASASRGSAGPTGRAAFCASGRENLCTARALHRASTSTAGSPSSTVADERYCFPLPEGYGDLEVAPLLCAGLIGHRALRMTGDARAARALRLRRGRAHRRARSRCTRAGEVFAFTRAGDAASQAFALELGCAWAGDALAPGARAARRGDHLRARRRARPGRAARVRPRRRRRVRGHPHERHPVVPVRGSCGRSAQIRSVANLTRADARRVPRARPAGAGAHDA